MNDLSLTIDLSSLENLLRDFYILTNIKIVIFDHEYNELLSYPKSHCAFCKIMNSNEASKQKCIESNRKSFSYCQRNKELFVYHCHANLIEACMPLIDKDVVIGYLMFGQISDYESKDELNKNIDEILEKYNLTSHKNNNLIYSIKRKSSQQINAASKILEACTLYVLLKNYISIQEQSFIKRLTTYIYEHLSDDLSVQVIAKEFNMSKNMLYNSVTSYLKMGVAEYIKQLRLKEAKRLLKTTKLKVNEISDKVGFDDYNYFCRVFKKTYKISAKQYQKNY